MKNRILLLTILLFSSALPALSAEKADIPSMSTSGLEEEKSAVPSISTVGPAEKIADSITVSTSELADRIIQEAEKYIGVPYRSGGKGPKSFDCSGFTRYVYAKFGYELSPSSSLQATQGREVKGSVSNLQRGDIIVFGMRYNRKRIGHVGIYIGPDRSGQGFNFIHASRHGIRISNSSEDYYAARFLGARRMLPDFISDIEGSAESIDSTYSAFRDTLSLGEGDYRIVLLSDSTWAFVLEDGTVQRPSELKDKIVLDTNGKWKFIPILTHIIPSLSTPAPQQKSGALSAALTQNDGEAVYHTIKSGDTLLAIAHKYNTTVNTICRLNGITSGTVLRIGRKLRVR